MPEAEKSHIGKKRLALLVIVLVLAAATTWYWWSRGRETTDDAFIDGQIFSITPRVVGYIHEVLVDDNQKVKKGQALVLLDATEYAVAQAEAGAALAEAKMTMAAMELGVPLELSQTGHRVSIAKAALASMNKMLEVAIKEQDAAAQELNRTQSLNDLALIDLRRVEELVKKRVVPQSNLDETRTRAETNQAQMLAAKARLEGAKKRRASLESDVDRLRADIELAATGHDLATIKARQVEAQKARVELSAARLKQAELNLEYTAITSPVDGLVTRKRVQAGQMVSRGQPLMAVVPLTPGQVWVTANFKETQLTHMHPGQEVTIRVDSFPDLTLKGNVESIMAGTGAVFSLFPPENATGNYVKVVQRVPVKIVFDPPDQVAKAGLRLGMSVIPTVMVGR